MDPANSDEALREIELALGEGADLVMVEDDDIEAEAGGGRERLHAGRAAVDADDQPEAAGGEALHRIRVRTVALEDTVGDVDDGVAALGPEKADKQRRRGGAVDVIVAEDRDRLAGHDRVGDPRRRLVHVGQDRRIRHQPFQRRIEEGRRFVDADAAGGEHPRDDVRDRVALGDRGRCGGFRRPEAGLPDAAGQRPLDAEEGGRLGRAFAG